MSKAERALIAGSGTKNVDAHDFFLRGRELLLANKRDRETFERSTDYLRRAIELDPNYAGPYAGLGMAYMLDYQNHWSDMPEKSLDEAARLINQSIARDDQDPFAYYVASVIYLWKRDYERSASEAETALTINPNYALALNARGFVYIYTGEPAKAITLISKPYGWIQSNSFTGISSAQPIC